MATNGLHSATVQGFSNMNRLFVAILVVYLLTRTTAAQETAADIVIYNGVIHTVDSDNAIAEAVAVKDGRIVAVGATSDIVPLADTATLRIDLEGKTVVPGFIDSHGHLPGLAQSLESIDLVGTTSLDEIIAKVAERAESAPAGEWILGRGWDQNDWPIKVFPHHEALSRATAHTPVYLTRVDGHAAFANAAALEIADVTADTPDPDGGKIIRDAEGNPSGVLIDRAQGLVSRHVPPPSRERLRGSLRVAAERCVELGPERNEVRKLLTKSRGRPSRLTKAEAKRLGALAGAGGQRRRPHPAPLTASQRYPYRWWFTTSTLLPSGSSTKAP